MPSIQEVTKVDPPFENAATSAFSAVGAILPVVSGLFLTASEPAPHDNVNETSPPPRGEFTLHVSNLGLSELRAAPRRSVLDTEEDVLLNLSPSRVRAAHLRIVRRAAGAPLPWLPEVVDDA